MLQCLAPSHPSQAVGSVYASGVHCGSQPCGCPPTRGLRGLVAEGSLGEGHSMGTQSQASDGPTARVGNDQSWCEV